MNITIDIPVNDQFPTVQLNELQKELKLHAVAWINKFVAKKHLSENELFEMPKEFDALRGSVSMDEIEKARVNDPMLDIMMKKFK